MTAPSRSTSLREWLRRPSSAARARLVVQARATAAARRFLPGGAAARRLAATTFLDVLQLAVEGVEAAQILVPSLPRILLAKPASLSDNLSALTDTQWRDLPSSPPHPLDPTALWVSRVRSAVDSKDLRSLNRLLADGVSSAPPSPHLIRDVLHSKFPIKPEGELTGQSEQQWVNRWRTRCAGVDAPISRTTVLRWARAKRDRAADLGGWTGRLILELNDSDPAIAETLAALWSLDPSAWTARDAATAAWRHLKASFIPHPSKPLPRPVATAPAARRAWAAHLVRHIRPAAASYCEQRGQFGLSTADGLTAYVIAARAFLRYGATLVVDDKTNSFHELHRSAVFRASDNFLSQLSPEQRAASGRPLVELLARTFAAPPLSHSAPPPAPPKPTTSR